MHDLIVVSDLHLGRGRNPETGRYYGLETFFYDDDFLRFCRYLVRDATRTGVPFKLILNGDVFDFLRVERGPGRDSTLTPESTARLLADILAGHPGFVDGLAEVLQHEHEVILLPGNHDLELQWAPAQEVVRGAVRARLAERGVGGENGTTARLRFLPWFYFEPGRIWLEHGCQYDPENAFAYPLRGRLTEAAARRAANHDVPLGNFFQKYLYNAFGPITFIVPTSRANLRYMKWLVVNQPRMLARVGLSHVPFAYQVLRRLSKASGGDVDLAEAHRASLDELARDSGLGDRLRVIDSFKDVHGNVVQAMKAIGWQVLKLTGIGLVLALMAVVVWFLGFQSITEMRAGFGLKTLLFLALNLFMLLVAIVLIGWSLLRSPRRASPRPFQRAATRIADLLEVPIVSFGHTHEEAIWPLELKTGDGHHRGWYFNTGTWIAVFTHDVLLPRERIQFTYLRVRGDKGELLHFSPGRDEPQMVVLLEDGEPAPGALHAG